MECKQSLLAVKTWCEGGTWERGKLSWPDIKEGRRWETRGKGPGKRHIKRNRRLGRKGTCSGSLDLKGCRFTREEAC